MYLWSVLGQGQILTSGDLRSHGLEVNVVTDESQFAKQPIRFDKLNTMRPFASIYLASVRRYKQKMYLTLYV